MGCILFEGAVGRRLHAPAPLHQYVGLCLSPDRFAGAVEQELQALGELAEDAFVQLVGEAIQFDPAKRPTAMELAQGLKALGAALDGPSLLDWIGAQELDKPTESGELTGRTLLDGGVVVEEPTTSTLRIVRPVVAGLSAVMVVGLVLGALVLGEAVVNGVLEAPEVLQKALDALVCRSPVGLEFGPPKKSSSTRETSANGDIPPTKVLSVIATCRAPSRMPPWQQRFGATTSTMGDPGTSASWRFSGSS